MYKFKAGDKVVATQEIMTYYLGGAREEINAMPGEIGQIIEVLGEGKYLAQFESHPATDCFDFELDHIH